MLVAKAYVGHREEESVADRLAAAESVSVVLSDTERRRSRVRTETVGGRDLGIVVARDLADGDVLEADDGTLVVVELAAVEALVLDVAGEVSPTAALELGHAVGNKHWDLAVRDGEVLLPVADSKARMEAAVAEHLPDVPTRYERVPPTTFDDGGADHSHGDKGGHSHADHGHSHAGEGRHGHGDHSHGDGHTHSHSHGGDGHTHSRDGEDHDHGVRTIDGGDP
ncbi:urease accessory protein UreE [Haloarcula salina]|uniref:urease accessory protein UreE n=1 Tax=Haloarcula salina TaxID=1429914 RepID=UPI003C703605